jgi:ribosomal protein S18 acetylase RimI-like enzyme
MAGKSPSFNFVIRQITRKDRESYIKDPLRCFIREDLQELYYWSCQSCTDSDPAWGGLVAELDGRIVGFMVHTADYHNAVYLSAIVVTEEYRGHGIGTAMIRRLQGRLSKLPFHRIVLHVSEGNSDAIRLYRRLGFRKIGRALRYYPGGSTAAIMAYSPEVVSSRSGRCPSASSRPREQGHASKPASLT